MSRRKDNKGRVLRTGESQRKDLIYQYRYTDALGNRKCIYASDLKILREKEDELQRSLEDGLDYAGGEITVYELLQRYLSLKCGVRYNTKVGYGFVMNIVQKDPFGARKIRDIKVSDAQRWMIKLQKEGKGYSTLTSIRGVVKPAFQMAYNEEVVRRNPFDFKLTDVVVNDSQKRISLTEKQQKVWMNFIREDKSYSKYYDEFVVLLGTGMRVSEFCGLTLQDLDFQNRRIRVDHQLIRESGGKYYVEKTKTECHLRHDTCREGQSGDPRRFDRAGHDAAAEHRPDTRSARAAQDRRRARREASATARRTPPPRRRPFRPSARR